MFWLLDLLPPYFGHWLFLDFHCEHDAATDVDGVGARLSAHVVAAEVGGNSHHHHCNLG